MSINSIRILLEDAAQTHPEKTALAFNDQQLTYGDLFTKVNQFLIRPHA